MKIEPFFWKKGLLSFLREEENFEGLPNVTFPS
jgi:hypothetical protein